MGRLFITRCGLAHCRAGPPRGAGPRRGLLGAGSTSRHRPRQGNTQKPPPPAPRPLSLLPSRGPGPGAAPSSPQAGAGPAPPSAALPAPPPGPPCLVRAAGIPGKSRTGSRAGAWSGAPQTAGRHLRPGSEPWGTAPVRVSPVPLCPPSSQSGCRVCLSGVSFMEESGVGEAGRGSRVPTWRTGQRDPGGDRTSKAERTVWCGLIQPFREE